MWLDVSVTTSNRLAFPCVFVSSLTHVHVNFSRSHSPSSSSIPSPFPVGPPVLRQTPGSTHTETRMMHKTWRTNHIQAKWLVNPSPVKLGNIPSARCQSALHFLPSLLFLSLELLSGHMIYSVYTFWCSGVFMSLCKQSSEASTGFTSLRKQSLRKDGLTPLYSPLHSPWYYTASWSPWFLWDWFVPHLPNMTETRTKMANI